MTLAPVGVGIGLGLALIALFEMTGLARSRGALAVTLCAIAAFYPVFAVDDGHFWQHALIFAIFAALAVYGFQKKDVRPIAVGLVAHGLFDAALMLASSPGPTWWPPFCAAVDVTFGLYVLKSGNRTT